MGFVTPSIPPSGSVSENMLSAELTEKINSSPVSEQFYAPLITPTAEGTAISVSDSAAVPIKGLVIYGKSITASESPSDITSIPGNIVVKSSSVDLAEYNETAFNLSYIAPDGLKGVMVSENGIYTDECNQQWICDTIEVNAEGTAFYIQRTGYIASYSDEAISSDYISSTGDLTSGAEIVYVLDTPIEHTLTARQLTSYHQGTIITNDKNAYMKLVYGADTKTYIDNEIEKSFNELSVALIAAESEE